MPVENIQGSNLPQEQPQETVKIQPKKIEIGAEMLTNAEKGLGMGITVEKQFNTLNAGAEAKLYEGAMTFGANAGVKVPLSSKLNLNAKVGAEYDIMPEHTISAYSSAVAGGIKVDAFAQKKYNEQRLRIMPEAALEAKTGRFTFTAGAALNYEHSFNKSVNVRTYSMVNSHETRVESGMSVSRTFSDRFRPGAVAGVKADLGKGFAVGLNANTATKEAALKFTKSF
jgi:hypothetical protein